MSWGSSQSTLMSDYVSMTSMANPSIELPVYIPFNNNSRIIGNNYSVDIDWE